ncbi:MAG: hypothetical protein GY841_13395 [FCB group bacterium]|nr:hypothetical protein [FCB group bacterium]
MFGRYTIITITAMLVLFAVSLLPAASNNITKLDLTHENGFTVLTISGEDQVRSAHQSVEAKEGKPFRIVIDCLAARHNLPHKMFADLPKSIITSIRTSQYAVQPEEVVRVVLDIADETVYRVESEGNHLKVYVSDPKTATFTAWNSDKAKVVVSAVPQSKQQPANDITSAKIATKVVRPAEIKAAVQPKVATKTAKATKPSSVVDNKKTQLVQKPKAQQKAKSKARPSILNGPITLTQLPASAQKNAQGPYTAIASAQIQKTAIAQEKSKNKETVTVAQKSKTRAPSITKTAPAIPKKKQTSSTEKVTVAKVVKAKANHQPIATLPKTDKQKANNRTTTVKSAKPIPLQDKQNSANQLAVTAPAKTEKKQTSAKPPVIKKTETTQAPTEKNKTKKVDLVGRTNQKANFFAALDVPQQNPPIPGREPSNLTKDTHQKQPVAKNTPAAPKAKSVTKPAKAQPPASKNTQAKAKSQPAPAKQDKNQVLASVDKPETPKTTSRFRRQRAKTTKMKQTQVVQFPQRIVTKYNNGGSRDPFKSLINEVGSYKGAIDLSRIPNIETLYLVGILESDEGKSSALMEDIDGIGYILKPGSRVKNGYVAQIDDRAIYFQINEYGWSRTIVKHMQKEN